MQRLFKPTYFSVPLIAFYSLVILGSSYRYLRIVFQDLNYFPYLVEVLLWGLVVLKLLTLKRFVADKVDFLMLLALLLATVSFFVLSMRYGVNTQLVFFATYALPLSVYFYVKSNPRINVHVFDSLLKLFTVLGVPLLCFEFYTTNYSGVNLFSFASYWEEGGVEGFHASTTYYAFLGQLTRPWGLMAMPQSTGSVFAGLGVYFFAKYFFLDREFRRFSDLIYLVLCLLAVYLSGSRTAIVVLALILLFIFRNQTIFLLISAGFGALMLATFVFTTEVSLSGFSNIFSSFVDGLTINSFERLVDLLFGQGLNSISGRVIIGIDEMHLINHLFYTGVFMYLILVFITYLLIRVYSRSLSKKHHLDFSKEYRAHYIAYILLVFTLILGALHYDPLMRYPSNVIVLSVLAIMSRDGLYTNERILP